MSVGYREIAAQVREQIRRGDYAPGETIPTLDELGARHGVGRETVRRAVAVLRAEGLVVPIRRRGTVVRDRTPVRLAVSRYHDVLSTFGDLGPWEAASGAQGLAGRTDLISVDTRTPDSAIALLLGIPSGANAICRHQHMMISDQVAQVQETWLPSRFADTPLAGPNKISGGLYRGLVALGRAPASATEVVTARMPTASEAQILHLDLGSPVLVVERVTRDRDDSVLLVARAIAVGDRVQLVYDQNFEMPR